ncbi:DMT family transporter [Roseibium sp. RKSG952]|uniref:DMT family transporter n=1 Tax=Roseibium sp. RKSG952 TaxID=2529384 RepID=UPI0012BD4FDB|nr:DMT family transporter [Roseibium sp. RKSG952]MTH97856.1 DMT family transporter [Roseibium sp. RKSG952]
MYVYELAALGAAALWALTGLVSADPARHLGALAFNRVRMVVVFMMLIAATAVMGGWQTVDMDRAIPLLISGFIGIFLGDTALFLTMNRLGPRRTGMLFSMNAPMSAVLGWWLLDETLGPYQILGIVLTVLGVVLAIRFGKQKSQLHQWESVKGPLWLGISLGLVAALCQSLGSLIARPVMETGVDPVAASAVRIGAAAFCLVTLTALPLKALKPQGALTFPILGMVALSGFLAMGLGMTLILFALEGGDVGIISTLSATTPALLLPLLWWRTREVPAAGAWIGAGLVVAGCGLLFAV